MPDSSTHRPGGMSALSSPFPSRPNPMTYQSANEAKANFDNVYTAPTPHAYIATMASKGYEIGEQARPYCTAAAELLRERNGEAWPVQMLDVGCSYGVGSAFIKYGCSFDEMVAFYAARAPKEYQEACDAMRMWLNVVPQVCDVRAVGLDSSAPAIRFGVEAGLLDGGIDRDFEQEGAVPTEEERAWFRSCNLMISTGAIGYVSERTLGVVLRDLGQDYPGDWGPFGVVTILRMFDNEPIVNVFEDNGYRFGPVPGVRLPQRRFESDREREKVLSVLHDRGLDTREWEDDGRHYADLYVAAPPPQFELLLEHMQKTHTVREAEAEVGGYIQR